MKNHQLFSTNNKMNMAATSLISVYNTHVYGYYRNVLKKEDADMSCLIITLKGNAKIILNGGKEVALREKSVFFGTLSSAYALFSICPHWHFLCYWFIPHYIPLPSDQAFLIKTLQVNEEDELSGRIIRLLQMNLENKTNYANSLFCLKILDVLEQINPLIRRSNAITDNIIKYINEHIEEPLSISSVASTFHYSAKHIRELFGTTLHISPKQYILKVKLVNIRYFLRHSDMTLQQLTEKYCFSSVSHLISSFKKQYDITPSQYRNKGGGK